MKRTITYHPASEADFEALAELRSDAMRPSLERVGRFDPIRSRERLRKTFVVEATEWILCDGERAGFSAMRRVDRSYALEHLYIRQPFQGQGIGSQALHRLKIKAAADLLPITVGALRDSDSNGFYRRHGFIPTSEDTWDIYYIFPPVGDSDERSI